MGEWELARRASSEARKVEASATGLPVGIYSEQSRILIDFGLPLVDENMEQFDSRKIKNKPKVAKSAEKGGQFFF